eukprot:CAMPEP_0201895372 /NCGR_PEP_ID=MMETSP0902-20130614/42548_1 /ASSEMBLY_ACC=CAM_ASM_000551 /TAXON_ID=420261 /ORGANISM="Thalassiosira antarctica, Strain CCMP982" /LENGTH=71 /DNA_ID=CAMNT_0048427675 /DNA_START=95 /DNA_END=306 /DNA_ORIENTATION=+
MNPRSRSGRTDAQNPNGNTATPKMKPLPHSKTNEANPAPEIDGAARTPRNNHYRNSRSNAASPPEDDGAVL